MKVNWRNISITLLLRSKPPRRSTPLRFWGAKRRHKLALWPGYINQSEDNAKAEVLQGVEYRGIFCGVRIVWPIVALQMQILSQDANPFTVLRTARWAYTEPVSDSKKRRFT
jgi:hypothetical protein